jgi:hypothetical protein
VARLEGLEPPALCFEGNQGPKSKCLYRRRLRAFGRANQSAQRFPNDTPLLRQLRQQPPSTDALTGIAAMRRSVLRIVTSPA